MVEKLVKKYGVIFFPIAVMAMGTYMLVSILIAYFEDQNYSQDGQIGIGTIIAKHIEHGGTNSIPRNVLFYKFTLENISPQTGKNDVSDSIYNGLKVGDKAEIQYLASDPTTHRLLGSYSHFDAAMVQVLMGFLTLLVGLGLMIAAMRRASRQSLQKRLKNQGVAISARVTKLVCDNPQKAENRRAYHITYEYEGPHGETITGKSKSHFKIWFSGTAEGDLIDIAADPKNPTVSQWRKEMK